MPFEFSETEKVILRDAVKRRSDAALAAESAAREAQRTSAHFEAVLNTLVRLHDLDPNLCQLRFDLDKDLWELNVLPALPQITARMEPGPDGGPPDIKALLGLKELEQKLLDA